MAVLKRGDEGGAGGRCLVETVGAMHEPRSLGAKIAQHPRERFEPASCKDAQHLEFDAGRIGERADEIENGGRAEFGPDRGGMTHRRMMRPRRHEADARLLDAGFDFPGRQFQADAERA